MTLDKVTQEVRVDAQQRASQILATAEEEASTISQKADEEITSFREQQQERYAKMHAQQERQLLVAARTDAQRVLLNAKKDVIDTVMERVTKAFQTLAKKERQELLEGLLTHAKKEIKVATVFVNKKDKDLLKGATVKTAEIAGGLIAQNKEGTVSVNLSIESLLEQVRHDALVELSEVLFQ